MATPSDPAPSTEPHQSDLLSPPLLGPGGAFLRCSQGADQVPLDLGQVTRAWAIDVVHELLEGSPARSDTTLLGSVGPTDAVR